MDAEKRSCDKAAQKMIEHMSEAGIENAWDRLDQQSPQCGFGKSGVCCRICSMGPCRITKKAPLGVCGADVDTIVARNYLRAVAGGTSAHSDHGRTVAEIFLAAARGQTKDYRIKDVAKLHRVAAEFGIPVDGRSDRDIAVDFGEMALAEFGKSEGFQRMVSRAPAPRQETWKKQHVTPRAIDREVVEALHRSTMGVDQDYKSILSHASRTALADGWGGSMLATDMQDILFGTPSPGIGEVNLGVLEKDKVNIIVHGHDPLMSEILVEAAMLPEMEETAKAVGAKGINISGVCCTANELLVRHGLPIAGNFLCQELAVATGAVEMMAVDVQCVMQGLMEVVKKFHTKLFTTAHQAQMVEVEHYPIDEKNAMETAKNLVSQAIENYTNRGDVFIPDEKERGVMGFTNESIKYMLGGRFRASYRPLNDNIMNGKIRGIAAIVGCTNPKIPMDSTHIALAKELIKRGLREVCETVGIPPILACGSCVDNSRLLVAASEIVAEGGLGEDLSDLPLAGACLESVTEKATAIGQYFVASGALVIFSEELFPYLGSEKVKDYLLGGIEEDFGGKWVLESDSAKAAEIMLAHIESKRDALGINQSTERKLYTMEERRELAL
ncbi:MAG: anaerobic carbon-monoxide dehydrogenase catalytic subunit [Planctomycetota bacterium]|jgi:carbon-monoxide dehydrogenase catalytic subunit